MCNFVLLDSWRWMIYFLVASVTGCHAVPSLLTHPCVSLLVGCSSSISAISVTQEPFDVLLVLIVWVYRYESAWVFYTWAPPNLPNTAAAVGQCGHCFLVGLVTVACQQGLTLLELR